MFGDTAPAELTRLDSFPYRHRVGELMTAPLVTAPPELEFRAASARMREAGVSSLVVLDQNGAAAGILTERDILDALALHGEAAFGLSVAALMSSPVLTVAADAFVYVALGRMERTGVRHLVATDAQGRAVGIITRRALLRLRAGPALLLGDQVAAAANAAELAVPVAALPALAQRLLDEAVTAGNVTAVIAAVIRDVTGRAAQLAELDMREDGWGPPPAPWCVLVLGSAGRGESLLAADQDNAIVHAGTAADDPWFAEAGRRLTAMVDQAGIPLCKGGVMASNPAWRRSGADWRREVRRWIGEKSGQALLNVDIFFDFQSVFGDGALAADLREHAAAAASEAPVFLRLLAAELEGLRAPLGAFGLFRTVRGRLDAKRSGLFPVVAAARTMALRYRIGATATAERLAALSGRAISAGDADVLGEAHALLLDILLRQQLQDIAAGARATTLVQPSRLPVGVRRKLRAAFRHIDKIEFVLRDAMAPR